MAEWNDIPQGDPTLTPGERQRRAAALLKELEASLAEADAIGLSGTGARLSGAIDLLRVELPTLDGSR